MKSFTARPLQYFGFFAALLEFASSSPSLAQKCQLGIIADLPVSMEGMRVSMPVKVDGKDMTFWLDSGAFFSTMSQSKATELGLTLESLPSDVMITGIGGDSHPMLGTAKSIGIPGHDLHGMKFIVGGSDVGNALIGRNLIAMADTEFDIAHGSLKLITTKGCDKVPLAYWAKGNPYFSVPLDPGDDSNDHELGLSVKINGVKVEAVYDTGAPYSTITRRAANRAGIDLTGPNVTPIQNISGIGRRTLKGWLVRLDRVDVGDEGILKPWMIVMDGPIDQSGTGPDMLIGMDYILAHHIYVSRDQKKIYFTYGGGNVFSPRPANAANDKAEAAAPAIPDGSRRVTALNEPDKAPVSAEDFATRAQFRLTQRNINGALADIDKAIEQAPGTGRYYRARATILGASGEAEKVVADLDKALTIDPEDEDALRLRAGWRFATGNRAGALADAEAAAKLVPPTSLDSGLIADLFAELGLPARSILIYDAMIRAHRDDSKLGEMYNGRCWARGLANMQLDDGLDDCNRALKIEKGNAATLDSRGLIYFRQGAYDKAVADYDAALATNPKMAWSLYMRGKAKLHLGQTKDGKADMAAATAIQPDVATIAKNRGIEE